MQFGDCRVGMEVIFGRGNGEYTRGVIEKINRAKAKVRTTENRGKTVAGTVWSVPYSLLQPANAQGDLFQPVAVDPPLVYHPFQSFVEVKILEAINAVYTDLSPENLTCDGELPMNVVNQRRAKLNRQLRGLFQALGRDVDEITAYKWQESREEHQKKMEKSNTVAYLQENKHHYGDAADLYK